MSVIFIKVVLRISEIAKRHGSEVLNGQDISLCIGLCLDLHRYYGVSRGSTDFIRGELSFVK